MKTLRASLLLIGLFISHSLHAQWVRTNGPQGGHLRPMAMDSSDLYVGGEENGTGVFRSTDDGMTWSSAGLEGKSLTSLAILGGDVFAATYDNDGVYRSTDHGGTWTIASSGISTRRIFSLGVMDTILLAGADYEFYYSTDRGANWTERQLGPVNIFAILVDGTTTYIGASGMGVARTTDLGASWTWLNSGLTDKWVSSILMKDTTMFVTTNRGGIGGGYVFRSTNYGSSWSAVDSGYFFASSATDGTTIFAGTVRNGMFVSTNDGGNWIASNTGFRDPAIWVWGLKVRGSYLFATTSDGFYRSSNGGANWNSMDNGLVGTIIQALAVKNSSIFSAPQFTGNIATFRTTDQGNSWIATDAGLGYPSVSAYAVADSEIFAGSQLGVFRSTNDGTTWLKITTATTNCLAIWNSRLFAGGDYGLSYTTNMGAQWTAVPPLDGMRIFGLACNGTGLFAATQNVVYRSTDNGSTWTTPDTTASTYSNPAITSYGTDVIAASSYQGIIRSTDNGVSWSYFSTGLPYSTVKSIVPAGSNLVAGTYGGGVYVSTDKGNTWGSLDTGLANPFVLSLALDGTNVYAGTRGSGVWRDGFSTPIGKLASRNILYDTVRIGSPGVDSVTLINTGSAPLHVTSIASDNSQFIAFPTSATVAPLESLQVQIKFQPTTTGFKTGLITIIDDGPTSPSFISVRGIGLTPVSLSRSSIAFGNVLVGSGMNDSLIVNNLGTTSLILDSVTSPNKNFAISPTSAVIPGLSGATFSITFTPLSAGAKTGKVLFWHHVLPKPDSMSVTGTGLAPVFSVAPSGISFGNLSPGSTRQDSMKVRNAGGATLIISSVVSNDSELTVTPTSAIIAPADSQEFSVSFSPVGTYQTRIDTITFQDNAEGPHRVICTATYALTCADTMQAGWNMVSLPVIVTDGRKVWVYPTAASSAFTYAGGYQERDTLQYGEGYWVKFDSLQPVLISGVFSAPETVGVKAGWNMIGSIGRSVPTSTITSIPGGMTLSPFFGSADGYFIADSIRPGRAYWVRVNQPGSLVLAVAGAMAPTNRVRILATSEQPPPPPDMRATKSRIPMPSAYALQQNYPNPFNPTTSIHYQLPLDSRVTLVAYDLLGRIVALLVDDFQQAGYKSIQWGAGNITSGVYFYRLEATSFAHPGTSFVQVRKMIVLK